MVSVYRQHLPVLKLLPDAEWALNYFRPKAKLGLLTDGYFETQRNKVRALNLEHFFDAIVYSDQLGRACWKPHPAPYEQIAAALGCEGNGCAYVADNPSKDFITARKLGWFTVRIRRATGEQAAVEADEEHEANATVETLYKLPAVLP
jgi:putative hydrolase of the HAD superfamily